MPLSIFDLQSDRKTFTIPELDLTVTYRPNQLTPARELAILRSSALPDDEDDIDELLAAGERNVKRQIDAFCQLVESWDLMGPLVADADGQLMEGVNPNHEGWERAVEERGGTIVVPAGQVIALTPDNLRVLPSHFLATVTEAINKDMRPDPKKRKR